ncbi:hypothetical protein QBC45DRAFT_489404 [Copromyces sp. CBS 386.78]|nr:hypothetical protein QBC45DRAFT_489404 [Copromyces sp. CBS 386.78]
MASLSIDSELMTNYVSAVPIPAGSHHVAVLDEKRMPMVFGLSSDSDSPQLQVLRRDVQGRSQLLNLHNLLGLPDATRVQTFHVEQSWDLTLYLAIAYTPEDTPSSSKLQLLKPFRPEDLKEGPVEAPISGVNTSLAYPDVILTHKKLNQTSSWGSDITHIHVQHPSQESLATEELSTPENASEILALAPAIGKYGQGLYVLYITQGITKIFARFLRPDPNSSDGTLFTFVTDITCPTGARCITSFLNKKGHTALLIAAPDGIHYLNAVESTSKDKPGRLILTSDIHRDIRQIFVAQDRNDVTIWFRNVKDELGYTRTMADSLVNAAETGASSMLLPASMSSAFAPIITAASEITGNSVRQMLVSNDRHGNLMLIEQSDDVGLWRKTPFYKPDNSAATELKSYTVTMKVMDENGNALSDGSVRISASSTVSVILNGQNRLLTAVPTWFDCDGSGSLDFIIPSDSLGSQEFRIEQVRSNAGRILKFASRRYDPSLKPMTMLAKRMSEADTPEKFASLKTQCGEALFDPSVSSDSDTIRSAHKCLGIVTQAYGATTGLGYPSSLVVAATSNARNTVGGFLMDGWLWVREMAHKVTEWFVDVANGVWKFACKIAGKLKEFVLDTAEKICEAATWIWEKLQLGWEKLVDFVGFVFNWDDILATKDTISNTITAALGYGGSKIDHFSTRVDGFFDDLERTIDNFGTSVKLDKPEIDSATKADTIANSSENQIKEAQSATATTWTSERLKNGGAGSETTVDAKDVAGSQQAIEFLTGTVMPEVQKLSNAVEKLARDIAVLFHKEGRINGNDLMNASKSLLKVGIQVVRGIIKTLLQLFKALLGLLNEFGNTELDLPIFSWLYKKLTKGHALTIFDAIGLILAIPTTIFAKLITGSVPPKFDNMSPTLVESLIEGGDVSDQVKSDWAVLKVQITMGVTLTTGAISLIKLCHKAAKADVGILCDHLENKPPKPSSLVNIFGIVVDVIGTVMAMPDKEKLPGGRYRQLISGISATRVLYHTVAYFAPEKPLIDDTILCLDLLTVLANFGLSIAVGVAEHEAAHTWKNYDPDATNTAMVSAGLNAIAGVGYFVAFFFRSKEPNIAVAGLVIMGGTMAGVTTLNGVKYKLQYDKKKSPSLTTPPAF